MKKVLVLAAAMFASINMFAQGTVNFGNNNATAVINSVTGAKIVAGNSFTAELWYAPDTGSVPAAAAMAPIAGARTGISPIAGLITGGTKMTPNTTAPGVTAYFQIRIWETAYGADWATAQTTVLNGRNAIAGSSDIIKVTTGNPGAIPPGTPGSLVTAGLKSFNVIQIVPEPSVVGLGLLGAGALMFLRRRK